MMIEFDSCDGAVLLYPTDAKPNRYGSESFRSASARNQRGYQGGMSRETRLFDYGIPKVRHVDISTHFSN